MRQSRLSLWDAVSHADREAAERRVERLRKAHPKAARDALHKMLVRSKCLQAGAVGALSALTGAIPGVGRLASFALGPLADTALVSVLQAELVLETLALSDFELPPGAEKMAAPASAATPAARTTRAGSSQTRPPRADNKWSFTGHNLKEFDIPFICRRLLINGLHVPPFLDFQIMKPWETNMVDTFQYWRFGDYKHYTSLKLLATALKVPSSKDDIDGSMVGDVYWKEKNLDRIVTYCQKDEVTTGNINLRFKNMPLLNESQVVIVP